MANTLAAMAGGHDFVGCRGGRIVVGAENEGQSYGKAVRIRSAD